MGYIQPVLTIRHWT